MRSDISNEDIKEFLNSVVETESHVAELSKLKSKINEKIESIRTRTYPEFYSQEAQIRKAANTPKKEETMFLLSMFFGVCGLIFGVIISYLLLTAGENPNYFLSFCASLLIGPFVGTFMAFVPMIVSSMILNAKVEELKNAEAPKRAEHNLAIERAKDFDKEELESLNNYLQEIERVRDFNIKTLAGLYSKGLLGPGYQNLIAACYILQFFESRQTPTLDAALQSYDEERRNQRIIDKLDIVIDKLDEIIDNQNRLYCELVEIKNEITNISSSLSQCEKSLDRIAMATELNAYLEAKQNQSIRSAILFSAQQERYGLKNCYDLPNSDPAIRSIIARYQPIAFAPIKRQSGLYVRG